MNISMNNLEQVFNNAIVEQYYYIGVLIEMEGFPKPELIINQTENFKSKLEYYKKTYDENLNHRYSKGIKIIDTHASDDIEDIEFTLFTLNRRG